MPKLSQVTVEEFKALIIVAQQSHLVKEEPIPEIFGENLYKVETCLKAPFQTFHKKELYKGIVKKAAIMFYLLIKNHPLANGNKRMAVLTLAFFCSKNRKPLVIDERELYTLAIEVATAHDKDESLTKAESFIEKGIFSS